MEILISTLKLIIIDNILLLNEITLIYATFVIAS